MQTPYCSLCASDVINLVPLSFETPLFCSQLAYTSVPRLLKHISVGTRGGARGALAPPLSREGGGRRPPPHFWAHTYLKIPPRALFFHPPNSTVLTPNQSVRRCFVKFIGVGTGGRAGDPAPLQCFSMQCVGGGDGAGPSCWKSLRASFSVSNDNNIFHNQCVSV